MKRNNIFHTVVFVTISGGVLYLLYTVVVLANENRRQTLGNDKLESTSYLLKSSLLESVVHTNVKLKPSVMAADSIHLMDAVTSKTVIFAFFESSCSSCLHREFQNVKGLESQNIPVLLITPALNNRELLSLANRYDVKSPVFLIPDGELLNPGIDDLSTLYYFVLDEKGNISLLFFPVQYEDQLSKDYLGLLYDLFTRPS